MRGRHVILNGDLVERENAHIGIDDLGFLVGDGAFETLRLYGGVPFLLEEHVARLLASLRMLDLEVPWDRHRLIALVQQLVERNTLQFGYGRLRITVTRGPGDPPSTSHGRPTLLITADGYEPPDPLLYERGVDVELSRHTRHASRWHRVKSSSYQPHLLLRREAASERIFDVLQWNDQGCLTEGSFTNVFVVDAGGVLHTPLPREGCLKGVTRNAVLTIAAQTELHYHEGGVTSATLEGAREMFLTGSLIEILPVRRVGALEVGDGSPGAVTLALRQAYQDFVARVVRGDRGA